MLRRRLLYRKKSEITPAYSADNLTFSGSNYVDTGIKLCDYKKEMYKAYSNISAINICLSKMGGTQIANNTGYWSSTQKDATYAYFLRMQDNYTSSYNKSYSRCTRAFGRLNIT